MRLEGRHLGRHSLQNSRGHAWWRRAVLPSLPWVVSFLSFFLSYHSYQDFLPARQTVAGQTQNGDPAGPPRLHRGLRRLVGGTAPSRSSSRACQPRLRQRRPPRTLQPTSPDDAPQAVGNGGGGARQGRSRARSAARLFRRRARAAASRSGTAAAAARTAQAGRLGGGGGWCASLRRRWPRSGDSRFCRASQGKLHRGAPAPWLRSADAG